MMIEKSRNGNLYYFNFKNYSLTVKSGNMTKVIFVGERIHERGGVFTETDFYTLFYNMLEA